MDNKTYEYLKNRLVYSNDGEALKKIREIDAKYTSPFGSDSYYNELNRMKAWADPYETQRKDPQNLMGKEIAEFDKNNGDYDQIKDELTGKVYTRKQIKNMNWTDYLKDVESSLNLNTAQNISGALYDIGKNTGETMVDFAEGNIGMGLAKATNNSGILEAIGESTLTLAEGKGLKEATKAVSNVASSKDRAVPYVSNYADDLRENAGFDNNTLRTIGNVAGSVVGGITATASGIPAPVAYGGMAGLRAYGNTDDVGDIAVETGLGAVYGTIFRGVTNAVKGEATKALTGGLTKNAVYLSFLQNLGVNVGSNAVGGYSANAITGTARNVYDKLRNREVDWSKPIFSTDATINALVSGAIGGAMGTYADYKSIGYQAQQDTKKVLQMLDTFKKQMADSAKQGDLKGFQDAYAKGVTTIDLLNRISYMGVKLNPEDIADLLGAWNEQTSLINFTYALPSGSIPEYTTSTNAPMPVTPNAPTTSSTSVPIVPQVTSQSTIGQVTNVSQSTTPKTYTPSQETVDLINNVGKTSNISLNESPTEIGNQTSPIENTRTQIKTALKEKPADVEKILNFTKENMSNREDYGQIQMIDPNNVPDDYILFGKTSPESMNNLLEKIKEQGFDLPIFFSSKTDNVVGGGQALLIAQALGLKEVPAKYVNSVSEIDYKNDNWDNIIRGVTNDRQNKTKTVAGSNESKSADNRWGTNINRDGRGLTEDDELSSKESKVYDGRASEGSSNSNPYSRQITTSRGTLISDDLADFTKNSEARDSSGKIMEVYHGTPENFTEFKDEFIGKSNGKGWGDGFYFTAYYDDAKGYAGENGNVMTEVLNIKKPLYSGSRFESLSSRAKELIAKYEPKATTSQPYIDYVENKLSTAIGTMDYVKSLAQKNGGDTRPILKSLGFDGIIDGDRYVIFDRTQAKDVKNIHPTNDPDTLKEPTKKYEPKTENSKQGSFSMPKIEGTTEKYIPQTKRKLLKDFEHVGYIDVNGTKIESADDLAETAQIFRDPTVETFRALYTDENNITVGQLALTSNLPHRIDLATSKLIDNINADIKKYKAKHVWLLHNHPTTDVTPSAEDKHMTQKVIEQIPKGVLAGHVIIDHNKYTLIEEDKSLMQGIKTTTEIALKKKKNNRIEKHISKEGWVDFKCTSPEVVAELASDLNNNKDYSTLIFTNVKKQAVMLQEVPNSFFKSTDKYINNYFRRIGRQNGATHVALATQDENVLKNLTPNLNLLDAVLYNQTDDGGIALVTSNARDFGRQKEIFRDTEPAHRLTAKKKEPMPEVETSLSKANKDIARLEKANKELQDKMQKQADTYEKRLAKKDEEIKDVKQGKKDALRKKIEQANKREEKQKEERSLKRLEPEKRLPKLIAKAKAKQDEYAENGYPELSEKFENEFGKTIRDIISTLSNQKIMRKLPDKLRELITNYKNETYLKANWKTFDKYLKEAIADKQLRDIINNSNTPVSERLLRLIQEHSQAPIIVRNAQEMKQELDDLIELVNAVKQSLEFVKADAELEKTRENIKAELDPLIEKNMKTHNARSETVDNILNFFNKAEKTLSTAPMFLPTRIQATMGGNPESSLKILWDNIERGSETEMRLDVERARLFEKFFENPNSRNFKLKGKLAEDFEENPKWGETDTPVGKVTRLMMMSIYGMTMNQDNLMHITPVLLGVTEDGKPIYSKPGGLIIPEERAYKRGDIAEAYANGKTVKLTQEDIDTIVKKLTPLEKEFVETCVKDVADFIAKEGNPVSMNLTGRELFHPNYLRILVSDDAIDPEMIDPTQTDKMSTYLSTMDTGLEGRMGRGGSLQGRTHKSTRPIYLEDLWRATNNSVNSAIKYISYAEALYDNDLILKTKFPNTYKKVGEITEAEAKKKSFGARRYIKVDELPKNGSGTYIIDNGNGYDVYEVDTFGKKMETLIAASGDDKFMKYYKDYVNTLLYGLGYANEIDKAIGKLAGMRAKVVLHANINVALAQQLSRPLIRQFLEQPTKSFLKGFVDKNRIYKIAENYLKEVGGVDTSRLSKKDVINRFLEFATYMNSYRGLGKVDLGWLMTMNDRSAVDFTFRVLIEDILQGKNEFSKEDMEKLKARAWQVARSNPSYLRVYKTPMQMAKSATVRALSQFQTVMILGYNNFLHASMAEDYYSGGNGNGGDKGKAKEWGKKKRISGASIIVSGIMGAIILELLSTLVGKEKIENFAERTLKTSISKILSYTIIGDEIYQWAMGEGYDLSTNDLGYANQLKNSLSYAGKMFSAEESKKPSATINFVKSVGSMIGLPMNSLENIFTMVGNITDSDLGKEYKTLKNSSALKKWLDKQEALDGTSMATYYDMYQATRESTLKEKYGYGTENTREYAIKRAIADVLGYPTKNLSQKQSEEIGRYYQIFK